MTETLNALMLDVRRAHRLLHAYNRRLLDTLRVAMEEVEKQAAIQLPVQFRSWTPRNYASPKPGDITDPGRWAWDGMPYAYADLTFATAKQPSPGAVYISIAHEVDGWVSGGGTEPDSRDFPAVESTRSTLAPVVLVPHVVGATTWGDLYSRVRQHTDRRVWDTGESRMMEFEALKCAGGGFVVDVASVASEVDVREHLTKPLVSLIRRALPL